MSRVLMMLVVALLLGAVIFGQRWWARRADLAGADALTRSQAKAIQATPLWLAILVWALSVVAAAAMVFKR